VLLSEKQLIILQGLINQAIKIDPTAAKQLEPLHLKSLRLQCTEPDLDVQIRIEQGFIELTPGTDNNSEQSVTTHIIGDLSAFIQVLSSEDKTSSVINSSLTVKGDSQLLMQLQSALSSIDFDWEYHLAKLIGDLPAHQIGKLHRHGLQFIKQSQPIFKRHLQEFLLEEAKLTPHQAEMDQFANELQQCTQQLERIEAKLKKAQKLLSDKASSC
jgi:ubiquinone biosynthesis protein UbiJ